VVTRGLWQEVACVNKNLFYEYNQMSSVQTQFAQVKTNTLVAYDDGWTHTQQQIVDAITNNDDNYTQVGNYYTLSSKDALLSFIGDHAGSGHDFHAEETLIDMGKELKVGVVGLGCLLTFRLVKRTNASAAMEFDGAYRMGYAIVDNRVSHDWMDGVANRLHVKLARTG